MTGYILDIRKSREEDLIVKVLTSDSLKVLYRFYGARHSAILIGHKIDFEEEINGSFLPRMRDVMHINFLWIYNKEKLFAWQKFIKILYIHLKDVSNIPQFYFDLLDSINNNISHQCYKRAIIEHFISMRQFEGLMSNECICASCHKQIDNILTINKELTPYHSECSAGFVSFHASEVQSLFEVGNSFSISDDNINKIYSFIF